MTDPATKRKWVSLGEVIALLALIVSALGLWKTWQDKQTGPTEVVEKKQAIPLILRGKVEDNGKQLVIAPVESSHALQSMTLTLPGGNAIAAGDDGTIAARDVESALGDKNERKGAGSVIAAVDARYVEAGSEQRSKRNYVIRYRWEGGGLFGGKSLRLTGFSRG